MTRGGREKGQGRSGTQAASYRRGAAEGGADPLRVGPHGIVVPDLLLGKLPGRGIYVSADRAAMDKGGQKGLFARAARKPVKVPEGLADLVEAGWRGGSSNCSRWPARRVMPSPGIEKVKDWLARRQGGGADPGQSTGRNAARASCAPEGGRCWFGCLTARGNRFGIRARTCDTRRACRWWTHDPCCRGSGKTCRAAGQQARRGRRRDRREGYVDA
jgi:hypothetical protein